MAKRSVKLFVQDIFECIEYLERYTNGISYAEFEVNIEKQDAVICRIEIIGEATKNLPTTLRNKYPHIPWKQMAGMRDVVTHDYSGVSLTRVWNVATQDAPALKPEIQKIIEDLTK
ncbi:MAG: DUF86 domain-containing protein [Saprospiraceae bacterium]|nr:DUF86 domain-containing protein [Saprospiraceae bacterium]